MDGHIAVESSPGCGSTFHFTLRMARRSEAAEPAEAAMPAGFAGTPVLVVDDSATNRELLARMLSSWQMDVTTAPDADAAIAAARRLAPHVAFIDTAPLDPGAALDRILGDAELLGELFDLFLTDVPASLARVETAACSTDATALAHAAHTLKGSAANVSALALSAAAPALERAAREDARETWPRLLEAVRAAHARVLPIIAHERERLRARGASRRTRHLLAMPNV